MRAASVVGACLLLDACATAPTCPPPPVAAPVSQPSTFAPGDRLRVVVLGQDDLSNVYLVDGAGRISMPLIGAVSVKGADARRAEQEIAKRLRAGYLRDPKVSVDLAASRPFYVLGGVAASGKYPFAEGLTIRSAIATAGGFSAQGDQDNIELTRLINGRPTTTPAALDTPLRPGDTITVATRIL